MKKILLVSPNKMHAGGYSEMFQSGKVVGPLKDSVKATMAPVELATLAALTPPDFDVDIWDEAVDGKIAAGTTLAKQYDIVGVTGYLANVSRMLELCQEFRRRGIFTAAGGPAVSNSPEQFRGVYDVVFLGEAEFIWPQFLREWTAGRHSNEYRQIERPNLADSPVPQWHKVRQVASAYVTAGVQTTRGCPFDCEFCDVIHLFGRKPRHKPIDAVIEEIQQLNKLGVRRIFFCDDNFIGDPHYAKELLNRLIPVNNSFERPIAYISQFTINVAQDDEMLRLLSEANFIQLYIGIETPRKASLMEVHKVQNTRSDLVEDVRKIQSYGIFVSALMMVGFDNDDATIFDELYNFLQDSQITHYRLHLLQSFPGTPQTARLLKEGRVLELGGYGDDNFSISNVLPAKMTREELFLGYLGLEARLLSWDAFRERMLGAIRGVTYKPGFAAKMEFPEPERLARIGKIIEKVVRARQPLRWLMTKTLPVLARLSAALKPAAKGRNGRAGSEGAFAGNNFGQVMKLFESLDPEARALAAEVTRETLLRAPWLVRDMVLKVMLHPENIRGIERFGYRLKRRLEIEKAPGYQHKILAAVQIPPDFKRAYKEQFGITLNWLRDGLGDSRLVPEGLVRVWKDFVIRYGATFTKFEDYHISSLKELVERTIEQGNSGQFSHTRSMADVDKLTSFQIHLLSEQIMFSVEQDLKSENTGALEKLTLGPRVLATAHSAG